MTKYEGKKKSSFWVSPKWVKSNRHTSERERKKNAPGTRVGPGYGESWIAFIWVINCTFSKVLLCILYVMLTIQPFFTYFPQKRAYWVTTGFSLFSFSIFCPQLASFCPRKAFCHGQLSILLINCKKYWKACPSPSRSTKHKSKRSLGQRSFTKLGLPTTHTHPPPHKLLGHFWGT